VGCSAALFFFKRELPPPERVGSVGSVYRQLRQIVVLPEVFRLVAYLMLYPLAFVAADKALHLRLIEAGFSKEYLATMGLVALPLSVGFAALTGRWSRTGPAMSGPFFAGNVIRLGTGVLAMGLLWLVGDQPQSSPSVALSACVFGLVALGTLGSTMVFVAVCAFFNEISPKAIGGTYLTMLNTVSNLGKAWSAPIVLSLIDLLGFGVVNLSLLAAGGLFLIATRPYLQRIESQDKRVWNVEGKV
jgi:PAT family acetyl-CoA transporter-like MFS transporter 1